MRMKLLVTAILVAAGASGAAFAGEPCAAVLCLSTNKMAPHQCKSAVDDYFTIREYHRPCKRCGKVFDPGATAIKRLREVLEKCPDARDEDRDYVTATYGSLEYSPFDYIHVDEKSGDNAGYAEESKETATESRFFTCQQAASMPEYAARVGLPDTNYPDQVIPTEGLTGGVRIEGGYVNQYLGTSGGEIVNGAKSAVVEQYGYAVQQRTVQRTVGQHKILSAGDWKTTTTKDCSIYRYYGANNSNSGG